MNISDLHKKVFNAEICPYCKSETRVTSQLEIYNRSYNDRKVICCKNYPECDSYVGTHSDGTTLGRLADKSLRGGKSEAHKYFDIIWTSKLLTRTEAYEWMSKELEIPFEYTHIGMFGLKTCRKVQLLSKELVFKNKI